MKSFFLICVFLTTARAVHGDRYHEQSAHPDAHYTADHHEPSGHGAHYKPDHHKPSAHPGAHYKADHHELSDHHGAHYKADHHEPSGHGAHYKPDHHEPSAHHNAHYKAVHHEPSGHGAHYKPDHHKPSGHDAHYKPDHHEPSGHGAHYKPDHHEPSHHGAHYKADHELSDHHDAHYKPDHHKPSGHGAHYKPDHHKPSHHGAHYKAVHHKPSGHGAHYKSDHHKPSGHGAHYKSDHHKPSHHGAHYKADHHKPSGHGAHYKPKDQHGSDGYAADGGHGVVHGPGLSELKAPNKLPFYLRGHIEHGYDNINLDTSKDKKIATDLKEPKSQEEKGRFQGQVAENHKYEVQHTAAGPDARHHVHYKNKQYDASDAYQHLGPSRYGDHRNGPPQPEYGPNYNQKVPQLNLVERDIEEPNYDLKLSKDQHHGFPFNNKLPQLYAPVEKFHKNVQRPSIGPRGELAPIYGPSFNFDTNHAIHPVPPKIQFQQKPFGGNPAYFG